MICAKIGPLTNRSRRVPCSSSRISVPVMSDGMRSGVNWIRLKSRSRMSASVLISSVFARPGHAGDQAVAAGEERDQHLLDDLVLADDDLAQLGENALAARRDFFRADGGNRRIHAGCP